MRPCPVWTLHLAITIVNANAEYLSVSVFPCAIVHCVCIPVLELTHVHFRRVLPAFGIVFIGIVSRQLAADDVASVWTLWVQSPLGPRQFGGSFVGHSRFPQPEQKKKKKTKKKRKNQIKAKTKKQTKMYACVRVCVHAYTHACMSVYMYACLSTRMRQV